MDTKSIKSGNIIEETVPICGLDCPDCALKVEKAIGKMPGVRAASVNFTASNLHVEYDASRNSREAIFSKVEDFGYEVGAPENIRTSVFRLRGLD
ncbi:MAG TPA: heavy metal-associated domain-containing protein [Candidatus Aquicultor sp.]